MILVLIINRNDKNIVKIAKKISAIYSDLSIITVADLDDAIERIKSDCPQVVIVSFDIKDSKGRDLLERLSKWDFEIMIYQDDELYCIQDAKVAKKEGYILKKM